MPETSTVAPYVLTAAGWPRPRVDGYPVPWVAPTKNLGEVNEGRRLAAVGGGVCQVCGLGFAYGEDAFAFTTLTQDGESEALREEVPLEFGDYLSELLGSATLVMLLDGAVLHSRCAKLTAAMCPHVRDRKDLLCVRVPANDADPHPREDGSMAPTYPAGDCELAPWPND